MAETSYDAAECARLNDLTRFRQLKESKIVITNGARQAFMDAMVKKTALFPENMPENVRKAIVEERFLGSIRLLIFDTLNDPYAERDFATFEIYGVKYFFKIDYYDHSLEYGSDDPTDLSKTMRVGTIYLPSEH